MRVIKSVNNHDVILQAYKACLSGLESSPRGQKVRNIPNMALVFSAGSPVITDFLHRKLNLTYCKQEWLWYLGADPSDSSITEYATAWKKLQQPDGTFFSNYGQYIFGPSGGLSQFEYVINQLKSDPDSRRASMVLLERRHLFDENTDTVCTYAINFSIVGNSLDMTVMMRSNDIVWGFTNDAFCFQQLYEFVYQILSTKHAGLMRGMYTHFANSMHVYERHYQMLHNILKDPRRDPVKVLRPTPQEAVDLFKTRGKGGSGEYISWLKAVD